jgi:hypothetical protein
VARRGGWKDQERVGGEGIDVDRSGRQRDAWCTVREALGGGGVREVERDLARGGDQRHAAEENTSAGVRARGSSGVGLLANSPDEINLSQ